jgi:hypothetical protein
VAFPSTEAQVTRYAHNTGHGAGEAPGEIDQVLTPAAVEAARFLCRKLPGVPKTSYVKYMYLIDREYKQRHGRTLSGVTWWNENFGPLNSEVTRVLDGPAFSQEHSTTAFGTRRIGVTAADASEFRHLGAAEYSVIEIVLAQFAGLRQQQLLDHVHALPEVAAVPMKAQIDLPQRRARPGTKEYLVDLLDEIQQEDAAGLYDTSDVPPDEYNARLAEAEALLRYI